MSAYENTFVSFVSETGRYCIGHLLRLGNCSLAMKPGEHCRIPPMGESGSVVINLGSRPRAPQVVTAWAQVGESSDACIEFYFNELDTRSVELIQELRHNSESKAA